MELVLHHLVDVYRECFLFEYLGKRGRVGEEWEKGGREGGWEKSGRREGGKGEWPEKGGKKGEGGKEGEGGWAENVI